VAFWRLNGSFRLVAAMIVWHYEFQAQIFFFFHYSAKVSGNFVFHTYDWQGRIVGAEKFESTAESCGQVLFEARGLGYKVDVVFLLTDYYHDIRIM
jgi:hypothetical protein